MRYPFVLWHFDGTLADTFSCLLSADNWLAARRGLRLIDNPQAARGLTPLAFLRTLGIPLVRVPSLVAGVLAAVYRDMHAVLSWCCIPEAAVSSRVVLSPAAPGRVHRQPRLQTASTLDDRSTCMLGSQKAGEKPNLNILLFELKLCRWHNGSSWHACHVLHRLEGIIGPLLTITRSRAFQRFFHRGPVVAIAGSIRGDTINPVTVDVDP